MTEMVPGLRFLKRTVDNDFNKCDIELTKQKLTDIINNNTTKETMFDSLKTFIELNAEVGDGGEGFEKMSASNNDSKIDLLDTKNQIKKKINKAYCLPGDVDDNSILTLLEKIIFPLLKYKEEIFIINRKEKFGGPLTFETYDSVKEAFSKEELHPGDLKLGVIDALNNIIAPIRETFENKELKNLVKMAYK